MRKVSIVPAVALLSVLFMVLSPNTPGRKVVVRSYRYTPATVRIAVGDAVTFANESKMTHTASCVDCSVDSRDVQPGLAKTITFGSEGVYRLACRYHSSRGMRMTVVVGNPAPSPSPAAS